MSDEVGEVFLWVAAAGGVLGGLALLIYACSRPAPPKPVSVSEAEAIKAGATSSATSSASARGGGIVWLPESMVGPPSRR